MRIDAIRLRDVRRFGPSGLALEGLAPGLNVLSEANESGKSTIFDAVRLALFYKDNSKIPRDSLEPYRGGAPEVELDLDFSGDRDGPLAGRRVRLHRRYHASRGVTELLDLANGAALARADDAHQMILSMVGADKPGLGPTGLLWVEQGRSIEQPKGGQETALLSDLLSGEIGAVTGGERADRYLAEVETRLGAYLTKPGKPRADYKRLLEDEAAASDLLAQQETKLAETDDLRAELERLDAQMREQDRAAIEEELKTELKAAEAALQEAQRAAQTLKDAQDRLTLAEQKRDLAKTTLTTAQQDQEDAKTLRAQLDALSAEHAPLLTAATQAKAALNAADKTHKQAAATAAQAREDLKTAHRAEDQAAARADFDALSERAEQAEAAEQGLRRIERQMAEIAIEPAAMDRLESLERDVAVAEAALQASATKIAFEPQGGGTTPLTGLTLDGQSYDGRAVFLDGPAALSIDGIGTLQIIPPDLSAQADALREAKRTLAYDLRALGLEDVEDARDRQRAAQSLADDRQTFSANLGALAPRGLRALREELDRLKAELGDDDAASALSVDAAQSAHDAAEEAVALTEGALRAAEAAARDAAHALALHDQTAAHQTAQAEQAETRAARADIDTLTAQLATAEQEAAAQAEALEALRQTLPDAGAAQRDVQRLSDALANHRKRGRDQAMRRSELIGRLETQQGQGLGEAMAETKGRLARLSERREEAEAQIRALALLKDRLSAARAAAQDRYSAPLRAALEPLLGHVIPDAQIRLGGDFTADGLLRNGRAEPIVNLSGGTQGQISVLTRLAFADILQAQGRPTPIIFDETFVHSDDVRLKGLFRALHAACDRGVQAFVMTCHQTMYARLGGHLITFQDWPED